MTGEILDYSIQTNTGAISGDDGNRYSFTSVGWQEQGAPRPGMRVDFEANGNVAIGIYSESRIGGAAPANSPATQGATILQMEVASSWYRIAAWFLEVILSVLTLGIGYLIWLVIVMAQGQTPAKQMLGLRVVRLDGSTASWGLMFGRGCCKFLTSWIPLVIVSFVMMLADDQSRAIHDRMVGTLVVRNR